MIPTKARRLGVPMLIFAAGMASAAVRLLMLALIGLPFVPFGIEHAFQSLTR
ncbi:hypothetical protein ACS8Y6_01800 [Salinisphaera sp. RV14]|uniref:hypothetical protein n=1 Tax=unclassified Salinisphaera TaxID=2649847 RepID=UPI003F84CA1D